jgi:hypothetical protein
MHHYLHHLTADLESAILARWRECPPHYFQLGHLAEPWLTPPEGYDGPPAGYAINDPDAYPPLPDWMLGEEEEEDSGTPDNPVPDDKPLSTADLEVEKTMAEMEQWRDEAPPVQQNMFYHFGFTPEQFPPPEQLSDADLDALSVLLCRLWAAYNFTAVVPEKAPGRVVYPLLLERMHKPTFVMTRGCIGIEFCHYEPSECPFGAEWCSCKDEY